MRTVRLVPPAVAAGAAAFLAVPLASAAPASPTAAPRPTSRSTVDVSTAAQLSAAPTNARPGQTIRLAPGTSDTVRNTTGGLTDIAVTP